MEEEDKERLRLNRTTLEEDLEVKDILAYLFQEGVIDQNTWDEILAVEPKTRLTRSRELLNRLPKLGKSAYSVFRKSLDLYKFGDLGEALDETKVEIVKRDDWLGQLSDDFKTRPPTDQELNRLAGNLGSNWERIGVSLGLRDIHIEQLKMQHGAAHMHTLIFNMVMKWKKLNGKAATWGMLLKTLIECEVSPTAYEAIVKN